MKPKAKPGDLHSIPNPTDMQSELIKTEEKSLCYIFVSLLYPFRKFLLF